MLDATFEDDPSIPPETVLWRLVHPKQTHVDPESGRRLPSSIAYDDNTDGQFREPMSAFISAECGEAEDLLKLAPGCLYVVKFTVGFARSLGLHVARQNIDAAEGHVVVDGGMRTKIEWAGKRKRVQYFFAHSFNPDEDWVISPPDA